MPKKEEGVDPPPPPLSTANSGGGSGGGGNTGSMSGEEEKRSGGDRGPSLSSGVTVREESGVRVGLQYINIPIHYTLKLYIYIYIRCIYINGVYMHGFESKWP